ncbi:hypothetical protein ACJMK2_027635 [Sinanodonta woodiana]|uniref:dolichyl-phosphate-mannose--protein mannosyltransferase n=1 Tax=Sinanodonta woodiana TaxID=1069815 RepID=A0ABD3X6R0_SINWO
MSYHTLQHMPNGIICAKHRSSGVKTLEKNTIIFTFNNNYQEHGKQKLRFYQRGSSRNLLSFYILTAFVAGGCYLNSLNGDFVHDDIFAIKNNKDVLGKTPVSSLFFNDFWGKPMSDNTSHKSYRPLTVLTFRWNHYFFGLNPLSFHVVNVILHVVTTCLFTYTCHQVFLLPLSCAILSALVFAVHPIHTEAISGIVGRADVLAAVMFLASFLCYSRSLDAPFSLHDIPVVSSMFLFVCSILFGGMAMLCKEHGITVLGFCVAFDVLVCSRKCILRSIEAKVITADCFPLLKRIFVIGCAFLLMLSLRLWMLNGDLPPFLKQDNPASFSDSLLTRCLTYSYLWSFNAWMLLMPSSLCYDWQTGSVALVQSLGDPRNICTVFFFVVLFLLVQKSCNHFKERYKNKPDPIVISLLLTVLPFLPAANIFLRVGFVVAERVLYIPSLGFCLAVGVGVHNLLRRWSQQRILIKASFVGLLAIMTWKTLRQNEVWRNRETLFRSGIHVLPHNSKVHYNYANLQKDLGNNNEAVYHYSQAIYLDPEHASAHNNLGTVLQNSTKAEFHFREALRINPQHRGAHVNLGSLLFKKGNHELGMKLVQRALFLDPKNYEALTMYGAMLMETGRVTEAGEFYHAALKEKPDLPLAYSNYGIYLQKRGNHEESVSYFRQAYFLDSGSTQAVVGLAYGLMQLGKLQEAEQLFTQAVYQNRNKETLDQLAMFYYRSHRLSEALDVYKELIQLSPNSTEILIHYALTLGSLNKISQAQTVFQHVLSIDPGHIDALRHLASSLGVQGRHSEAVNYLQMAISKVPHSPDQKILADLYFEQGNHYSDLGQLNEAFRCYNMTLHIDPTKYKAHANLGAIYHIQGDLQKAKHHYQALLSHDPDNEIVKENIQKLDRLEQRKKLQN